MENGGLSRNEWRFRGNEGLTKASALTVRGVLNMLMDNLNANDSRPVIPLGHGDPSAFPSFRTATSAEDALCSAIRTTNFNGYSSTVGIPAARSAVANYLSKDLPCKLSPDDVYLTIGCTQALETIVTVLANPKSNILLPRPGFPYYEARAGFSHLEVRHYDLVPEKDWEVDLEAVEAMSDENTVAMVIINPGNPCGNVFKYEHLKKIAETAKKLGMLVISDEVYDHLTFGSNPFVPMGVFASIVPVVTVGSISKRWIVPGWRLGWLVTNDPDGILMKQGGLTILHLVEHKPLELNPKTYMDRDSHEIMQDLGDTMVVASLGVWENSHYSSIFLIRQAHYSLEIGPLIMCCITVSNIVDSIKGFLNISSDPATFSQGALPQILENTPSDFFEKIIVVLGECANILYDRIKDIPCLTCPRKPEGSMFVMVKLNLHLLEDIKDDLEFCHMLAKEESVIVLPGLAVGLENWLRITFAVEPSSLDDGLRRIKAFHQRHQIKQ